MKQEDRHWYITTIAAIYFALCSFSCVRYAFMAIRGNMGTVPLAVQLLSLGMTLSAGTYFVTCREGHRGMIFFTIATLLMIGTSDPNATFFHLFILSILLLPFICRRPAIGSESEPGTGQNAVSLRSTASVG